jgi:uncharacterized membrane protein YgcG
MRKPRHTTYLALAALLALFVAGCGGGGDSTESTAATTTETTPTPTKAELISQGDAICAEVNAAVGSIGSSESEVPAQITQVANLYTGMVASLQRLGTPEDNAGYANFVEAAEELAKVEGEVKLAAEREDTAALGEAATEAAPALEEFQSQAAIYGFEECSEGPSAPTPAAGSVPGEAEEGGVEVTPEEVEEPEAEEVAPEEAAPETGGAGGGVGEGGGTGGETGGGESGGSSGGVGPG